MTSSNIDFTTGHSREIQKIPNRKRGFLLQFLVNHQKKKSSQANQAPCIKEKIYKETTRRSGLRNKFLKKICFLKKIKIDWKAYNKQKLNNV